MRFDRREFLRLSAATAAASSLPAAAANAATSPGRLRLVFFTDTHIQPELRGDAGTAQAVARIRGYKPDLCIQGGDHVFDINATPRERSNMLLDLYEHTEHALDSIPVHHCLGNHDIYGLSTKSGIAESDPLYGKKCFAQRFNTKTYYSFDRAGYHFVVLDSIAITPDRYFDARIDADQIAWLSEDLAAQPAGTPVVVTTHCPLVSAAPQYEKPFVNQNPAAARYHTYLIGNAFQVLPVFEGHNIIAVLQGHTHLNETVWWRNVPYITSGAVCGNWWKGPLLGTPEGFTIVEFEAGRAHWRYDTYGWHSAAPAPTTLPPIEHPRTT